jgi:hypothetical protein
MAGNKNDLRLPLAIVVLISAIEVALIVLGILPPILSYSLGNLLFSFAHLVVVAYAGMIVAGEGLRKSAQAGGAVAFTASFAICILAFFCSSFFHVPILGVHVAGTVPELLVFAMIIVENTVLGALVSVVMSWVSLKFGKGK